MKPSPRIESFIKSFEAFRAKAYLPTPRDVPTIGWGSTGPDVRMGMTWTREQADAKFDIDIAAFAKGVEAALHGAATTQNQFDAMVSLAYNIGIKGFATSTVARQHKAGHHAEAAAAFGLWNKQKGVVLNGLTRRRAAEAAIYTER